MGSAYKIAFANEIYKVEMKIQGQNFQYAAVL